MFDVTFFFLITKLFYVFIRHVMGGVVPTMTLAKEIQHSRKLVCNLVGFTTNGWMC